MECTDRNFCTPHYRNLWRKVDETSFCLVIEICHYFLLFKISFSLLISNVNVRIIKSKMILWNSTTKTTVSKLKTWRRNSAKLERETALAANFQKVLSCFFFTNTMFKVLQRVEGRGGKQWQNLSRYFYLPHLQIYKIKILV